MIHGRARERRSGEPEKYTSEKQEMKKEQETLSEAVGKEARSISFCVFQSLFCQTTRILLVQDPTFITVLLLDLSSLGQHLHLSPVILLSIHRLIQLKLT